MAYLLLMHFCPFSPIPLFKLPYLGATEQLRYYNIYPMEKQKENQLNQRFQAIFISSVKLFEWVEYVLCYWKKLEAVSPAPVWWSRERGLRNLPLTRWEKQRKNKKRAETWKEGVDNFRGLHYNMYGN